MKLRHKLRPVVATIIVVSWLAVELLRGINNPTLGLRVMLLTSLVWLFGESIKEAFDLLRGNTD